MMNLYRDQGPSEYMPSYPILYSFRRCPYAMRARMALLISGMTCEIREIILRDKPAEMLAASPKATVPVLVLPNGSVLDESLLIMRWALVRHDPENWLSGDDTALLDINDGAFKHHLDRYKYPNRHDSDPAEHRSAGLAILQSLETRLAHSPHLCGEHRTLCDIAIMPFIRQFAATDPDWFAAQPLPHLQNWLAGHMQSALFHHAMKRFTPWQSGDAPTLFCEENIAPMACA